MEKKIERYKEDANKWAINHYLSLGIFNIFIIFMFLLLNAGYFHPFFPLTINIVFFMSMVLAVFLFRLNSKILFFIAIVFWIFAGMIKILGVDVWAERTAIYVYQSLFLGVLVFLFENISSTKTSNKR